MKIVIVGCGRVGSTLAENLDADGHEVIIFDIRTAAFDRLPETFKGAAVRGDGTDEEVLRRSGAQGADIFLALTEGDNRNIMAAQLATESFAIPQVIAKINDPVRAAAYSELGVVTLCRTNIMVDSVSTFLNLPMQTGPGIDIPETPGHEHPHPSAPTIESPAPPAVEARAAHGAAELAGRPTVNTSEADAVRARRLGFRRTRG
jgi:trk system potassium uptake protein TrkA